MPHQYTVPLKKLIKDLNLQILYYRVILAWVSET